MEDGYHLVQVHALDFTDDGDIVLELLRSNDVDYTRDVVRINIKSGEAFSVRKALCAWRPLVCRSQGWAVRIHRERPEARHSIKRSPRPASTRIQPE